MGAGNAPHDSDKDSGGENALQNSSLCELGYVEYSRGFGICLCGTQYFPCRVPAARESALNGRRVLAFVERLASEVEQTAHGPYELLLRRTGLGRGIGISAARIGVARPIRSV